MEVALKGKVIFFYVCRCGLNLILQNDTSTLSLVISELSRRHVIIKLKRYGDFV